MRAIIIMIAMFLSMATMAQNSNNIKTGSPYDASETAARIVENIKLKNIEIFAVFDHAKNAENVGLSMPPAKVIVFGSPKAGTPLMQQNASFAIELPLKILVYENGGKTYVERAKMAKVAENYGLHNNRIIENMDTLLNDIVNESIKQ